MTQCSFSFLLFLILSSITILDILYRNLVQHLLVKSSLQI